MTTQCPHFSLLQLRLSALSGKFLDGQVTEEATSPATFQPDLDCLAAFRLLIHAEMEDFLEQKAKENLKTIPSKMSGALWMRGAPEILCLAMALEKPVPRPPLDVVVITNFVNELVRDAQKFISDNNGIKSNSFLILSLCAGKTLDEVDSALSLSLNSYGKSRGDVAHKSVTHTNSLLAPSAERSTAVNLITQLGAYFDVHA